jgi:general nucleoside transport system permease protein
MIHALEIFWTVNLWAAVLRIATPLMFGVLGALLCERAGVLNLGIEGIMTFGAMIGWFVVFKGGGLWMGVLAAACIGAAIGSLHGALTVPLGLSQHVTGIGVTLLASSLSYYIFRLALPVTMAPPSIVTFSPLNIPILSDIPFVGPTLFAQAPLTYLGLLFVAILSYVLFHTPIGLAIRMVGENPHAAEAQGISVTAVRMGAVIAGSALMGVGGSYLTLSAFNSFFPTMVQGRGWICLALVLFAFWKPGKALFGALLYGLFDAYQLRLQTLFGKAVPYEVFLMLPYIMSIVALAALSRRAQAPQALLKPFRRGER